MADAFAFIESNTTGTGRLFAQAARQAGMEPVLFTALVGRHPWAMEDGIRTVEGPMEESALLSSLNTLARHQRVAGVLSSSEYFVPVAARIASRLSLAGPDAACVERCRDKSLQRQVLCANGVSCPAHRRVESVADAVDAARAIGLPVVVKPTLGSGSLGVRLCHSLQDVDAHARRLLSTTHNERGLSMSPAMLVEEFIQGAEYSVETFGGRAIAVTRKHLGAPPNFVEIGHDCPAHEDAQTQERLVRCALEATRALGLEWGPSHVEVRTRAGQAYLIEVNPRLGGGMIPVLLREALGVDLMRATVDLACGRQPSLAPTRQRHASIRFVIPSQDGTVSDVSGLEAARRERGVYDVSCRAATGQSVRLQGDFRDRCGHVIAVDSEPHVASCIAERALKLLSIEVLPTAAPMSGSHVGELHG